MSQKELYKQIIELQQENLKLKKEINDYKEYITELKNLNFKMPVRRY
jgi:hypothetical protein